MKPTKTLNLLAIVTASTVSGFLIASLLVARGLPVPVSPTNLLITLAAIAAVLLLLSIPIWRYRSQLKPGTTIRAKRVDPFYAVRVVLLAKASSIAAAMFIGWHGGVLIYQLSGTVVAQALVIQSGFGLVASVALLVCALVTEQICRLPNDSNPDPDQAVSS